MVLQRLNRRDEHDGARDDAARAADDVDELLEAHVGAEAALGDEVVGELRAEQVGHERVVAVGDVGERPAVDERGLTLHGLHEVRLQRFLEQDGHRAGGADLLRGHRRAVERRADRDCAEARPQVGEITRDGDDRHHLRGRGDVEPRLAWIAVRGAPEPEHDLTERPVVHVETAPPGNRMRIEAELVPVQEMGVDQRREQVVGGADRMDVAGEVEVDLLHRHDLRPPAARAAALDPEDGPERRLAQAEDRPLADRAQRLDKRDRGRRLAFAGLGRRHRRDGHDPAVGPFAQAIDRGQLDLRRIPPE